MLKKLTNVCSWWRDGETVQVLAALTSLFLFLYFFFINKKGKEKCPPPPGPRGLPLVGYLPFLGSDLCMTFRDLADTYGPIFKLRLGYKECIVVSSPSLAKEVLRDQDVTFANRNPPVAAKATIFGASEVVFTDYGPEWRKMKRIFVSEMLSNANLEASNYVRTQQVKKMISRTYKRAGELVDTGELIFVTVISTVMSMVWGDNPKGLDSDVIGAEFRSVSADYMQLLGAPNISDYLPFLAIFDLQGICRKIKLVADRFEKLFDLAIDNHNSADSNSKKNFLGCLLQLTKLEDPAASLTLPQVKGILVDAIIGGMDTTATTIEWAMTEVLKQPKVMRTVQEELAEIVGLNNGVEEGHLPKLKYLNAVLKETLRLHPPVVFLVPHSPSISTTLGGYRVSKNSQIFINTWVIHRDPQIWEDPSTFKPERFLNGSAKLDFLGNQYHYIPFGSGRRMCTGITLAEKTAMYVLASLLHAFEWKLPHGTEGIDISETFGIVVKKTKPTMAVPIPRLSKLELYTHE